ncbi:hypothetical protein [uncultured Polaribacter sp.]|uniref:hypothetical protein n=1 Tax=uncultured Polaribacter sp. TaxID=174711 RepID=UPI0026319182|nr:hypothetical protein [uncultured Polaribacter sp.]
MNFSVFSQNTTNNYKYIIVPEKFDFLKKTDEYQTSSLMKFLLKKKGFEVFLSNEKFPAELAANKCLALFTDIKDASSMFSTKSTIQIKDCSGKLIFSSKQGKSKEKAYKKAYHESIRNAYNTMSDFSNTYLSSNIEEIKKPKNIIDKPVGKTIIAPQIIKVKELEQKGKVIKKESKLLYAQPNANGFQLVNMTPKVVFIILKTNVKDVFVIKDKNGILFKNNSYWLAQYYENNQLVEKEYQIKF